MSETRKGMSYTYRPCQSNQIYPREEIVDNPDSEIDVVNITDQSIEMEVDIYGDEEGNVEEYYVEMVEQAPVVKPVQKHVFRKQDKTEKIAHCMSGEKVDIIKLGTSVMVATSDRTLNQTGVAKAIKNGISETSFVGDISIEALVEGMMTPSASDGRFAMLGTSVMWNALKSNMRNLKGNILEQTSISYTEPRFDGIDVTLENIPIYLRNSYDIQCFGVFSNADLYYVFSLLRFRKSAKLLNKVKQFLKAYFIVACRPRCMIWRYTLRRSGNSNKKAILNLPNSLVQIILKLLIDSTGIGSGEVPYHELDQTTPFYQSLGEDEELREQRYYEACKLKDPLINFFREAITDCLNEIREMPFSLTNGTLISPLRGRIQSPTSVTWKDYESLLKQEHDMPSEANIKKRMIFEQKLCENITGPAIRRQHFSSK